jgi:hypothetical protein
LPSGFVAWFSLISLCPIAIDLTPVISISAPGLLEIHLSSASSVVYHRIRSIRVGKQGRFGSNRSVCCTAPATDFDSLVISTLPQLGFAGGWSRGCRFFFLIWILGVRVGAQASRLVWGEGAVVSFVAAGIPSCRILDKHHILEWGWPFII